MLGSMWDQCSSPSGNCKFSLQICCSGRSPLCVHLHFEHMIKMSFIYILYISSMLTIVQGTRECDHICLAKAMSCKHGIELVKIEGRVGKLALHASFCGDSPISPAQLYLVKGPTCLHKHTIPSQKNFRKYSKHTDNPQEICCVTY